MGSLFKNELTREREGGACVTSEGSRGRGVFGACVTSQGSRGRGVWSGSLFICRNSLLGPVLTPNTSNIEANSNWLRFFLLPNCRVYLQIKFFQSIFGGLASFSSSLENPIGRVSHVITRYITRATSIAQFAQSYFRKTIWYRRCSLICSTHALTVYGALKITVHGQKHHVTKLVWSQC